MLERTKERHIEQITIRFRGPADKREEAERLLKKIGYVDLEESVPWREAFPEFTDKDSPVVFLKSDISYVI